MTKSMFVEHHEPKIIEYNSFINDIIGVMSFNFGLAALQFSQSYQAVAFLSFSFMLFYLLYRQIKYRHSLKAYFRNWSNIQVVAYVLKNQLIYLIGLLFLCSIAFGLTTPEFLVFTSEIIDYRKW